MAARGQPESLRVGGTRLALTVCFECGLGRFVAKKSWREIGAEYDVAKGRLWPLVLIWILLGPEAMRRAGRPRSSSSGADHDNYAQQGQLR